MTTLNVWWNKDKAGKALGVLTCQCRVLTHEGLMIKAASDAQLNFHSLSTALSMGQTQAERQRQRQRQRRLQWGCFDGLLVTGVVNAVVVTKVAVMGVFWTIVVDSVTDKWQCYSVSFTFYTCQLSSFLSPGCRGQRCWVASLFMEQVPQGYNDAS